jgi:hypothetical protein
MGNVETDVVRDFKNENYKKVYVQWWVPMTKGANNDEELYHNYWLNMQTQNNGLKSLMSHFLSWLKTIS